MKNIITAFLFCCVPLLLFSQKRLGLEIGLFKCYINADKDAAWRILNANTKAYYADFSFNTKYFSANVFYTQRIGNISGRYGAIGAGSIYDFDFKLNRIGIGLTPTLRYDLLKHIFWQPGFYIETTLRNDVKGDAYSFHIQFDSTGTGTENIVTPININTIQDNLFNNIDIGLFNSLGVELPIKNKLAYYFKIKYNLAFRSNWAQRIRPFVDIGLTTGCYFN